MSEHEDDDNDEQHEDELADAMFRFRHDPLGHVLYSYSWGEGELAGSDGPDEWQTKLLDKLGKTLRNGSQEVDGQLRYVGEAIQEARASGHGIGKSALVSWLILWSLSTFIDTKGVVTANTKTQLQTKTWSELAKWHRLAIFSHWFVYESTSIHAADPKHAKTWRIDAIPWSKENHEAFAGLHNKGKRILLVFDEASAIDDIIWETSEGALTDADTEIMWFVFGNPTRNTGRFRECWRKFRKFWGRAQIDARTARMTNKKNLDKKIDAYGIDSDYVKVRILGQFPHVGDRQFISSKLVDLAFGKHIPEHQFMHAPKILTLDNAWTGSDKSVIGLRQGLCFSILKVIPKNDDDVFMAGLLAQCEDEHKADAVFIDAGYGQGVFSVGKRLNREWNLVSFGASSSKPGFANKRAEMYGGVKEWLGEGGAIPADQDLYEDLIAPEYDIIGRNSETILESKEDMRDRGLDSPDKGDSLALSFAFPVQKKKLKHRKMNEREFTTSQKDYDYLA